MSHTSDNLSFQKMGGENWAWGKTHLPEDAIRKTKKVPNPHIFTKLSLYTVSYSSLLAFQSEMDSIQ